LYAVTGEAHPQMFAQRWTAAFQHFYQRPKAESLTEKMDHVIATEFARNNSRGEAVKVQGMNFLTGGVTYKQIQALHDSDVMMAHRLYRLQWVQKRVCVRGSPLPDTCESPVSIPAVQHQMETHLTNSVQKLQFDQARASAALSNSRETLETRAISQLRCTLNVVQDDPEVAAEVLEALEKIHSNAIRKVTHNKRERGMNVSDSSAGVEFPPTGRSRTTIERRKRMPHDRRSFGNI
jgi:hypothetical protein